MLSNPRKFLQESRWCRELAGAGWVGGPGWFLTQSQSGMGSRLWESVDSGTFFIHAMCLY